MSKGGATGKANDSSSVVIFDTYKRRWGCQVYQRSHNVLPYPFMVCLSINRRAPSATISHFVHGHSRRASRLRASSVRASSRLSGSRRETTLSFSPARAGRPIFFLLLVTLLKGF